LSEKSKPKAERSLQSVLANKTVIERRLKLATFDRPLRLTSKLSPLNLSKKLTLGKRNSSWEEKLILEREFLLLSSFSLNSRKYLSNLNDPASRTTSPPAS